MWRQGLRGLRGLRGAVAVTAAAGGVRLGFCEGDATGPKKPSLIQMPTESDQYYVKSQRHLTQPTAENPYPTQVPPPISPLAGTLGVRHIISIIGLPDRGKTFIAHQLGHYLTFFHGAEVQIFNINDYLDEGREVQSAGAREANGLALLADVRTFMDSSSKAAGRNLVDISDDDARQKNADSGRVAIVYDSRSSEHIFEYWSGATKDRRRWLVETIRKYDPDVQLMFVEITADKECLTRNVSMMKEHPATEAEMKEHEQTAQAYMRSYVTLQTDGSEEYISWLKLLNYRDMSTNRMHGYLRMRVAQFLSTLHPGQHTIYLSRHGFSEYNRLKKIGGNPPLTEWGHEYARRLGKFASEHVAKAPDGTDVKARLWTSSLQRTIQTAQYIPHPTLSAEAVGQPWVQMAPRVYRNIDEIFAGEYEGMTYDQVAERFAQDAQLRKADKIGFRYPRGESYYDLISRLDPVVHELQTYKEPLLIVSHQALLRPLRAYLLGLPRESAPSYEIPLHTVMKITWDGWHPPKEEQIYLGPIVGPDGQKNI